mgnify:CR=1 FL=1
MTFHDGATFEAEDAVFSLERAMEKTSNYSVYTQGIDKIVKDVLELTRREAAVHANIPLKEWLVRAVAQYQEGYSGAPRPIRFNEAAARRPRRRMPARGRRATRRSRRPCCRRPSRPRR